MMKLVKMIKINMPLGITAEDMHQMIDTPENPVDIRDLTPYTYPDVKGLQNCVTARCLR